MRWSCASCVSLMVVLAVGCATVYAEGAKVFPGAVGFGTDSPAGRGGKIIRVTTLEAKGPGSLREAIEATGPRIVVFEVGGIIDLAKGSMTIREPFITIAGQTAPSPGITIIRGSLRLIGDALLRQPDSRNQQDIQ